MKDSLNKIINYKIKKGWIWLLYIDLFLPFCLFVLAYLLREFGVGQMFARLFHSYNLYILSPIPDFKSLTGILGLIIHIGIIGYALKNKDIKDAIFCLGISILTFLYILLEFNYSLTHLLNFV